MASGAHHYREAERLADQAVKIFGEYRDALVTWAIEDGTDLAVLAEMTRASCEQLRLDLTSTDRLSIGSDA